MPTASPTPPWSELATAVGIPLDRLLVAGLSGGADSVFLVRLAAAAGQPLLAVHVDHGLRGAESRADAESCAELCRSLGVPLQVERIELPGPPSDLEARARALRYRALCRAAARAGAGVVATAHHAGDAAETLLLRWIRSGGAPGLAGLAGPAPRLALAPRSGLNDTDRALAVARPLLPLSGAHIRAALAEAGLGWREDSSNAALGATRNRVRHALVPALDLATGGGAGRELAELGAALARLDGAAQVVGGARGRAARAPLAALGPALQRLALGRLVAGATGRPPGRALLARIQADLRAGRSARHALPGGAMLELRPDALVVAPADAPPHSPKGVPAAPGADAERALPVPGDLRLADGRRVVAELVRAEPGAPFPRGRDAVELDAAGLPPELRVRLPRPGDRFRPLGAPGTRRLCRFLADAGLGPAERARVPLVFAGDELLWVAGLRPAESRRVRPSTALRLRLSLAAAAGRPR